MEYFCILQLYVDLVLEVHVYFWIDIIWHIVCLQFFIEPSNLECIQILQEVPCISFTKY
jgi:hypothetical protein